MLFHGLSCIMAILWEKKSWGCASLRGYPALVARILCIGYGFVKRVRECHFADSGWFLVVGTIFRRDNQLYRNPIAGNPGHSLDGMGFQRCVVSLFRIRRAPGSAPRKAAPGVFLRIEQCRLRAIEARFVPAP